MKEFFVFLILFGFCREIAVAAEVLPYPELQVSPRASERILMETKTEKANKWSNHLPIQISALSTLLAGFYSQSKPPTEEENIKQQDLKWSQQVSIGIGSAWLIGTYFLAENYEPYIKAQGVIQGLSGKTNQEILIRERIAEEHIESAAQIGNRLMWASVISNLAASAYLGGSSGKEGRILAGVSGLLAFTPFIFKYNWQTVSNYHREYKKKIYSPIAMLTLTPTSPLASSKDQYTPGVSWLFVF